MPPAQITVQVPFALVSGLFGCSHTGNVGRWHQGNPQPLLAMLFTPFPKEKASFCFSLAVGLPKEGQ